MISASNLGLPSVWQFLPHGFGTTAGLEREVGTQSAAGPGLQKSKAADAQGEWHPFGPHVPLSDVVSRRDPIRWTSSVERICEQPKPFQQDS